MAEIGFLRFPVSPGRVTGSHDSKRRRPTSGWVPLLTLQRITLSRTRIAFLQNANAPKPGITQVATYLRQGLVQERFTDRGILEQL
jgi:hypothetical protein